MNQPKNVSFSNIFLLLFQTKSAIIIVLAKVKEEKTMAQVFERIKELRTKLHLSQDYVATYLGMNRATFSQLENGNRRVTADDLSRLSTLFGVSADSILHGSEVSQPAVIFARSFENLDEMDQAEIMNLIRFKEQMKAQRAK